MLSSCRSPVKKEPISNMIRDCVSRLCDTDQPTALPTPRRTRGDCKTLTQIDLTIVIPAITTILIGLVLLPYGIRSESGPAPMIWGLANTVQGCGWLLIALPVYLSNPPLRLLANLLFAAAMGLLWSGTAQFMHLHRPPLLLMMPTLITLVTFPFFVYIIPSLPARVIVASVVLAISCGDSGWMLLRDQHRPTRVLGYLLLGLTLAYLLRGVIGVFTIWYPKPLMAAIASPRLSPLPMLTFTIWTVGMLASSAHRYEQALRKSMAKLERASLTDQLTELPNRRLMQQRLEEAMAHMEQTGEGFSLLLFDIDHFKQVNDRYGHEAGDYALCYLAQRLRQTVRHGDMVARWGGEEFLMLMPNADASAANQAAERLRAALSQEQIAYGDGLFQITVTIGGSTASPGQSLAELFRQADHALYLGKQMGRNQVRWA